MRTLPYLVSVVVFAGCADSTELSPDAGSPVDAAAVDSGRVDVPPVDASSAPDAARAMCGPDERNSYAVFFGTVEPTAMPLSPGQVLAVVDFDGCGGAFVTDEWVLTANHCGIRVGSRLCVGTDPANADVCFTADRIEDNPDADMTLVHVDAPASTRLPELEPIPIMVELMDATWLGRTAEAAGYGSQEDDSFGEREFTAEPIVEVGDPYLSIDGMGTRGVCFGDSGGPVMVLASDSTVRVAGVLSWGDPSCVGVDNFTRADLQRSWIEAIIGPVLAAGAPCGTVTAEGDCMGSRTAIWCDDDARLLTSAACEGAEVCGWSGADAAFRCVASDPCDGVGPNGECRDGTAVWCDAGTLRRRDCAVCGDICRYTTEMAAFYCAPDPCAGVDPAGVCDGTVLTTCDSDGVRERDCAFRGRRCGFDSFRGRNRCVR